MIGEYLVTMLVIFGGIFVVVLAVQAFVALVKALCKMLTDRGD